MRHERRGVALVLVLWLVVVLGGLAAGVVTVTRASANLAANAKARSVARYAAESGIESTLAEIEDSLAVSTDSASRTSYLNGIVFASSSRDSFVLGDARFAVVVVDPGARLDVNAAPVENLSRLFARFTDVVRSDDMARAIRRHIERAGAEVAGADVVLVSDAAAGAGHFVAPVRSVDALSGISGVDSDVLRLAAPFLTVDGDGTINRSTAPEPVLAAAFGELRDSPSRLVIVSRGWMRGHPLTHEIQGVYAISNEHLVLVHWRERER